MEGGVIQVQSDHTPLRVMIDSAYAYATEGKAEILTWYQIPQGPIKVAFMNFYKYFELLYDLTCQHENVSNKKELTEEIKKWFLQKHVDTAGNTDPKNIFHGIDLFDMYRLTLIESGLISWSH